MSRTPRHPLVTGTTGAEPARVPARARAIVPTGARVVVPNGARVVVPAAVLLLAAGVTVPARATAPASAPASARASTGVSPDVSSGASAGVSAGAWAGTSAGASAGVPAPTHGVWPLSPRPQVVAGFDPPADRWGAGHRGVDLAGRPGQPVLAAQAGRVTFAGRLAGRGVVAVGHGSTRTTYQPVASTVRVGDRVEAGAVLGRLDLFGSHCFPRWCLHWGLVEGADHYLDPLLLVRAAPIRLLPLSGAPGILTAPVAPGTPTTPVAAGWPSPVAYRSFGLWVGPTTGPIAPSAQARGWAWR